MPSTQTITYNGFTFPFAKLNVTQQTVYADDRITAIGTAYTFEVSGVLHGDTVAAFQGMVSEMQGALSVPRKAFSVAWDGITFYSFEPSGSGNPSGYEVDWGPQPDTVRLTSFMGGKAAFFSWTLRLVAKECYSCTGTACTLNDRPSDVLAIIYRYDHNINANGFTTRTITGKLIVSATSVAAGKPADTFRLLIAPQIPNWFKREDMRFAQSEDGTTLDFSFTDAEQMWMLPTPITNGYATYSVHVRPLGARADYVLSGRFEAPATISKSVIVNKILELAQNRFPVSNTSLQLVPESFELTEDVYGNGVSFNIQMWSAVGLGSDPMGFSSGTATFGIQPPGDSGTAYFPQAYGQDGQATSGVIAAPPQLFDPCKPPTTLYPTGGNTLPSAGVTGGTYQGSIFAGKSLSENPTDYGNNGVSTDHMQAPYVALHETISYTLDNGIRIFPPKVTGQQPYIQQVHLPFIRVIQAGYATRDVKPPNPAPAVYDSTIATPIRASIEPQTPVPIGNGQFSRFTLHWTYEFVLNQSVTDLTKIANGTGLLFPQDVRRQTASGQSANTQVGQLPSNLLPGQTPT